MNLEQPVTVPDMQRAKRARRGSTTDRASEDTIASSSSNTTASGRPKRIKKEDLREQSTNSDVAQPPSPNSQDVIEEMFTSVVQLTDEKGAQITTEFALLPSKQIYPDYYQLIKRPIDLKTIATRIQKSKYSNLDALADDFVLMFSNAMEYNAPASQIYKDAQTLRRFVGTKKSEFEQRESHRTTERTVRTRRATAQPASAIYAALEYGGEEAGPGADDDDDGAPGELELDSDDETSQVDSSLTVGENNTEAMEELYNAVVKLEGPKGRLMCGPFLKLPSKRVYPEYYSVILTPVALSQIKKKIKRGFYVALDEMILDLQLMCQNAQTFNDPSSSLYKDSDRIRTFVEERLKDFQKEVERCSSPLRTSLSERLLPEYDDTPVRKRMKFILRGILECKDKGVYPVEMFLEKPLKKDYPNYYEVITHPIDIKTIVTKLHTDRYPNEDALLSDIRLLCENAKFYNEEDSDIHKDALKFDEIVRKAQRTLGSTAEEPSSGQKRASNARKTQAFAPPTSPKQAALIELYEFVSELRDDHGRRRSEFFQTLPQKAELPSYYDVIKKPVDLDKIQYRILHDQYETVNDIIEDFGQMFENAATFNDPKSQIYKDALILLTAVMEKGRAMGILASEVPNVRRKVQEILQDLMESLLKYEDGTGRNLSDALADAGTAGSESGDDDSMDESPQLTLETIRANVYRGRYRRLDAFQDDIFRCLENIRETAQADSASYEDSVALHIHFIVKRDELCGAGTKLLSPALHYTVQQFQQSIDQERREARRNPQTEGVETVKKSATPEKTALGSSDGKFVSVGSEQYFIGDFVYIEAYEKGKQPLIVCIEEFVPSGEQTLIRGSYMYRPHETFHTANKTFFEKDVFKSDMVESHLPTRIICKCHVMGTKDYFRMKPVGFDFKDVYVCDARYYTKLKGFKKIKVWNVPENSRVRLVEREKPLPAVRVPSIFAEQDAKSGLNPLEQCADSEVIDVVREPVLAKNASPDPDYVFYEQKDSPIGYLKIGDCALLRNETTNHIVKISKIYSKLEETFISGTTFIFPVDLEKHSPAKLFYVNEVFQKTNEASHPVSELTNRCAVLTLKDYATCRQTEILEDQVYIMESKIQDNGQLFKRPRGARFLNVSTTSSSHATDDEIFFFDKEKAVNAKRVVSPFLEAALSGNLVESDTDGQESPLEEVQSYDDDLQSVAKDSDDIMSVATPMSPTASTVDGPAKRGRRRDGAAKRSPKKQKYTVSGFILYGAEHRRTIKDTQPGLSFQETSRAVSDMWKNLTPTERKKWDNEARRKSNFINDELRIRGLTYLEGISFKGLGARADHDLINELEKRILEKQATDKAHKEMLAATAATPTPSQPSQPSSSAGPSTSQGGAQNGPGKTESNGVVTLQGSDGATVIPPQVLAIMQAQQQQIQRLLQQQQQMQAQQAQTRPLFLTLPAEPPKVKRALHSEVFLRYLENNGMSGSSNPKPVVPAWKRQFSATPANSPLPNNIPDMWPSLLQIDATTKNRGMELINRMWNTRNLMTTGIAGVRPLPVVDVASMIAQQPHQPQLQQQSSVQPMSPPAASRPLPLRRTTSSRR